VHSLPVPQQLAHAAFIHCIILSLHQLLKLNDDEMMMIMFQQMASLAFRSYKIHTRPGLYLGPHWGASDALPDII